jgi:hypothetical protein
MGWLDWLFNPVYVDWERLPRVTMSGGGEDVGVALVGEASFQSNIRRIDTNIKAAPPGWEPVRFSALMIPEPDNPHDRFATVVCVSEVGPIGRVASADRGRVKDIRNDLLRLGAMAVVDAKLVGGWGEDSGRTIPPGVIVYLPIGPAPDDVEALTW